MAIDERDYMRESARRVVEATYNTRVFRSVADQVAPARRRSRPWLPFAHLLWSTMTLAASHARLVDVAGHAVARRKVLANFGQPMRFGIQVQAVDGGAP